jgi:hypothetical protein
MAQSYFYEVLSTQYQRSNKNGSVTTFAKGETVETDGPVEDERLRPLEPGGKAPSRPGFLPEHQNDVNAQRRVTEQLSKASGQAAAPAPKAPVRSSVPPRPAGERTIGGTSASSRGSAPKKK